jgi:hypothetical protein
MDKNIAAILREDTRTVGVAFLSPLGEPSRTYRYITDLQLEVGDTVVVPAGGDDEWKIGEVMAVDSDLEIEPNATMKFKWVVDKIDLKRHRLNMERNEEIEKRLAKTYRSHARQAYASQFLLNADPDVVALVKGEAPNV